MNYIFRIIERIKNQEILGGLGDVKYKEPHREDIYVYIYIVFRGSI